MSYLNYQFMPTSLTALPHCHKLFIYIISTLPFLPKQASTTRHAQTRQVSHLLECGCHSEDSIANLISMNQAVLTGT